MAMHHHGGIASQIALFILLVFLPMIISLLYGYFSIRLYRINKWSGWRIISFMTGSALIIMAMLPPVSVWAHPDMRGHMVQHLFLGMFGPIGLVFGAPGTLLIRSVPVNVARRIAFFFKLKLVRFITHPVTAALLDMGGMFVLYLTPFYTVSMTSPGFFIFLHVHFVLSGYLFAWSVAGPDPAPRRPGKIMQISVLFVATAAHAILSKLMYVYGYPHGTIAGLSEIQSAAELMYYGGDIAEFLLIVGFFAGWFRRKGMLPETFTVQR